MIATRLLHWPMCVQAYDQHLNMILGEVEEVVTSVEIDDETYEEIVRVRHQLFLYHVQDIYSVSVSVSASVDCFVQVGVAIELSMYAEPCKSC